MTNDNDEIPEKGLTPSTCSRYNNNFDGTNTCNYLRTHTIVEWVHKSQ